MTKHVDFEKYKEFVNEVTSNESKHNDVFFERLAYLKEKNFPSERLLTAAVGMSAEAGEFTEVIKKIIFQAKDPTDDKIFHLKRELGDIMWYVMQACIGMNVSLEEIVEMNVEKLLARYPEGAFDVYFSENRKEGDL